MTSDSSLHPLLIRIQKPALIAGAIGLLACVIGVAFRPDRFFLSRFFLSYLFAYLFWIGIALGCLAVLMLQHVTGGAWGLVTRRLLESGSRMILLMAVLFIPLIFGLPHLYVWASHDHGALEATGLKAHYLTRTWFLIRAAIYFAAWISFSVLLSRWSAEEDRGASPRLARKFELLSSGGLLAYVLTISFASVDWVMSLDPHWFSTIFGMLFMAGQGLSGLAFAIALVALLSKRGPLADVITRNHFHDLGNLLLAFTMFWAYIAFSQYLIIWSGNLAEETPFYIYRTQRGWQYVALALIVLHFFIPFLLLLNRRTKRSVRVLGSVALGILVMRLVDLFWVVVPHYFQGQSHGTIAPQPFSIHWLDIAAPIGIGGIFIAAFVWQVRQLPLLPLHDARLAEVTHHG